MFIDFLIQKFEKEKDKDALIWKDKIFSYGNLADSIHKWKQKLDGEFSLKGNTVALEGDFSPNTISLLLALIEKECIIIPLNYGKKNRQELMDISLPEYSVTVGSNDEAVLTRNSYNADNDLYRILRERGHPGLVLFSSGTSGAPKAAVHDFTGLLEKFKTARNPFRTLNFLLFDHWGGLNTMFHTLSNGGTLIFPSGRSPDEVCALIEKYKAELLPVSPTFLNLLLISEAYKRFNLSSLKVISYGTEAMSLATLNNVKEIFPDVKLHQTYGLIEVGVMRTKSKDDGSLWLKLGGEGYQTRVVDNILQIKSHSAILGYLNYPSPFTDDGWFVTGDYVEVDGDYFKILGRKSEIINVGGEKVYPSEVENVIKEINNVADVNVFGDKNPITGNIVCAEVSMIKTEDKSEFKKKIRNHCRERLQSFKIPSRINIVDKLKYSERFKKKLT